MSRATNATTPSARLAPTAATVAGKTLRVFSRTPQLVGATIGQGVLFLLVFRYVFGGAIDTGALRYIDFITPGVLTAAVLFAATGAAVGVAEDRADGFTDRVLSLPTSRGGLVVGRTIADTAVAVSATVAAFLAAVAVGFRPSAPLLHLAAAGGLLILYALAFSALFGALGGLADGAQTAQTFAFLAIPITFVSSAYVPTDTMPAWLATIADHQPVTPMIDAVRHLLHSDVLGEDRSAGLRAVGWAVAIATSSLLVARHHLAQSKP